MREQLEWLQEWAKLTGDAVRTHQKLLCDVGGPRSRHPQQAHGQLELRAASAQQGRRSQEHAFVLVRCPRAGQEGWGLAG